MSERMRTKRTEWKHKRSIELRIGLGLCRIRSRGEALILFVVDLARRRAGVQGATTDRDKKKNEHGPCEVHGNIAIGARFHCHFISCSDDT